ncbi:uncharacterized protein LOC102808629 [Saccoglossus kowalevskii]|uniref:Uncharacterized protein LOC102808629 n=1 Tax=Saccoglossus kowalevskii TaxID=10224 RepID=A0ABM0M0F7_SACKO|nr:PREDICTED: uncharacterized protein LOC102808629 [Saccoglossus kowalevskii]
MWKLGLWVTFESDNEDEHMDDDGATRDNHHGDDEPVSGLMESNLKPSPHMYAQQVTMQEYEKQCKDYTKQSLQELLQSEEYQRRYNTCSSCNACWYNGHMTPGCSECGGYAINRSCAICHGKCVQIWTRDTDMSHSMKSAHWNGKCGLSETEQHAFILHSLVDANEETLNESMEDL